MLYRSRLTNGRTTQAHLTLTLGHKVQPNWKIMCGPVELNDTALGIVTCIAVGTSQRRRSKTRLGQVLEQSYPVAVYGDMNGVTDLTWPDLTINKFTFCVIISNQTLRIADMFLGLCQWPRPINDCNYFISCMRIICSIWYINDVAFLDEKSNLWDCNFPGNHRVNCWTNLSAALCLTL